MIRYQNIIAAYGRSHRRRSSLSQFRLLHSGAIRPAYDARIRVEELVAGFADGIYSVNIKTGNNKFVRMRHRTK